MKLLVYLRNSHNTKLHAVKESDVARKGKTVGSQISIVGSVNQLTQTIEGTRVMPVVTYGGKINYEGVQ